MVAVAIVMRLPSLEVDGLLRNVNQRFGIDGVTCERLGFDGDGLGRGSVMSGGRMVLQVVCGEGCHLLLQCCKVGLVFKKEGLTVGVSVGKIGYIGSRTGIVDAGVSKGSFLAGFAWCW